MDFYILISLYINITNTKKYNNKFNTILFIKYQTLTQTIFEFLRKRPLRNTNVTREHLSQITIEIESN